MTRKPDFMTHRQVCIMFWRAGLKSPPKIQADGTPSQWLIGEQYTYIVEDNGKVFFVDQGGRYADSRDDVKDIVNREIEARRKALDDQPERKRELKRTIDPPQYDTQRTIDGKWIAYREVNGVCWRSSFTTTDAHSTKAQAIQAVRDKIRAWAIGMIADLDAEEESAPKAPTCTQQKAPR